MKKNHRKTLRHEAGTPKKEPVRRFAPENRITPGSAEGDLQTINEDLKIQDQRKVEK